MIWKAGQAANEPAEAKIFTPKVPGEHIFAIFPWLCRLQTIAVLYAILAIAAALQDLLNARFNNFYIFRQSFIHLINGSSLYVSYSTEQGDLFKYSPTFALVMAPFWAAPIWIGLPAWNLLNAFSPILAVKKIAISPSAQAFILLFAALDLLTCLQNSQSNGLVVALMIGTFASFERGRPILAALLVCLAFYIKIFGIAVAILFVFYEHKKTFLIAAVAFGIGLGLIPALVTGIDGLLFQYQEWHRLLRRDQFANVLSLIGALNLWFHVKLPNAWCQIVGAAVLAAPLLRRDAWRDFSWRLRFLSSVLIWVIIFNHRAESSTFVIAMFGIAMWGLVEPPSLARGILLTLSFALTSLSTTDLFPRQFQRTILRPLGVKAMPSVVLWMHNVWRLASARPARDASAPAPPVSDPSIT